MTYAGSAEVAFGLGSNLGDKAATLRRAVAALAATGLAEDLEISPFYLTEPWGPVAQDRYVNACAVGATRVPPEDLLRRVKALEVAIGRTETVRWGPRVIDIDILYYGEVRIDSPALTLPHPEMLGRAFVLVPLAHLRPDKRIKGVTVAEAASSCDRGGIRPLP